MKNYKIFAPLMAIFITLLLITSCKSKEKWNGNLLIVTMDTTRADHIGTYGNLEVKTPNIDLLAKEGVMFKNCYSAVPLTLPSHCTIFTGKYPLAHGVRNNGRYQLDGNEKTLAEMLKEYGYNTYAVISSFVLQSKFGLAQGFDEYDDSLDSHKVDTNFESQIDAEKVYEKFSGWFQKNWDSKFFAWVHFYDPHTPYLPHGETGKTESKDFIKLYDGEISYMDKYLGKIINSLKEKNILDKTLIVLVGDHGEAFGEHKEFASHMVFCYEANLKVPFIIYNRKLLKKSSVIEQKVSTVDLVPTVLKLMGIKGDESINGDDLTPYIKHENRSTDRILYFESLYGKEELNWAPLTGIIDGKYKYISLPRPELYDLDKDPEEKDNLYIKKRFKAKQLDKKLKKSVIKYSGNVTDSKRELEKEDLEKLKALGYISSFTGRSNKNIDPKDGIVLNVRLKKISSELDKEDLGKLEKELREIRQSKLGRDNFLVYDFLYRIYMKKRDIKKAMDILRKAMKNLPNSIPFRVTYAKKLKEMGKFEDSIEVCNSILKIDKNFTPAHVMLGEIYDLLGNDDLSDMNFSKAIESEPNNISMKIMFAEKLIKEKKFPRALEIYNSIIDLEDVKDNSPLLFKIALFNTKYGSLERASDILERVENGSPKGKYYYFHALILSKMGRTSDALFKMKIAFEKYGDQLSEREREIAKIQIARWSSGR